MTNIRVTVRDWAPARRVRRPVLEVLFGGAWPFGLLSAASLQFVIVCAAVRLSGANGFDHAISAAINRFARRSELFDIAVRMVDQLPLFQGVAIFALVYAAFAGADRRQRLMLVLGGFAAAVAATLSRASQFLLPENPRPQFDPQFAFTPPFGPREDVFADWSSFPSDHASLLFGVACSLFLVNRRLGLLGLMIAAVAGLARVYRGLHYPTDVLGGAFLGCAAAFAAAAVTPAVERWLPRAWMARHRKTLAAAGFLLSVQAALLFSDVRELGAGLLDQLHGAPAAAQADQNG